MSFAGGIALEDNIFKAIALGAPYTKLVCMGRAIAFCTLADKLSCGLQQMMAGARKFNLSQISRNDLFAGNRETARETGIVHMAEANDESAKKILSG